MTFKPIRWTLWIFLLALIAVALALAGRYGTGHAVFVLPPWRVEMSMLLFGILLAALLLVTHLLALSIVALVRLPGALRRLRRERGREAARRQLLAGMKALFGGRFDEAERLARDVMDERAADAGQRDLAAALAAWAVHEVGNHRAALPYLDRIAGEASFAMRDASRAYMLLAEGKPDEALPLLTALSRRESGNVGAMKMKVEAEIALGQWDAVRQSLDALARSGLLPAAAATALRLNAETQSLVALPTAESAMARWRTLDAVYRYDARLVTALAARLAALDAGAEAADVIEETVEKRGAEGWDSGLMASYAAARTSYTAAQIERAEDWLTQHPRDAQLLAALGTLCARQSLWGKAQSYLEASLALQPSAAAHMSLARLMEQLDRHDDAMHHIRRAAVLAHGGEAS